MVVASARSTSAIGTTIKVITESSFLVDPSPRRPYAPEDDRPSEALLAEVASYHREQLKGHNCRQIWRRLVLLLTHAVGTAATCHWYSESSTGAQVRSGKAIWRSGDRNDEMELRVNDAKLAMRIDDASRSASSRDSEVLAAAVPQSLSFYAMFYKVNIDGE